jgi:hypothetical protein
MHFAFTHLVCVLNLLSSQSQQADLLLALALQQERNERELFTLHAAISLNQEAAV